MLLYNHSKGKAIRKGKTKMKYGREEKRQVMQMAWQIRRKSNCTMSKAMKTAWAAVKALTEAVEIGEGYGITREYTNLWEKYGKSRLYIGARVYTNAWNLKRDVKGGYVDMMTAEFVAA
jgi:hypothetical protein